MKTAENTEALAGRYVITGRIGSGGMGTVLRARDSVLGRTVALKVLPVDLARQHGFVDRFRAEAKAAARVSHPNVVQVHDWGEEEHTYYMVLEYVRGRNLRQVLSRGPLEPVQASQVMSQVLAALAAAHEKGLVHRDVKPENILVAVDGTVKVTDFGIARVAEAAGLTGSLMGTVAYAAPEQARGEDVDGRTDLYSAGCVLYELLTGSLPFEGDAVAILQQHLNSTVPPPSAQRPEAAPLDQIVLRATAPRAADRFSSAAEMRTALQSAAGGLPRASSLSSLTDELTSEVPVESLETALPAARAKKRMLKRSLLAIAVPAIAGAVWLYRPAPVPDVVGLEQSEAVKAVQAAGLDPGVSAAFSDVPQGEVFASEPPPGRFSLRGTDVKLVVSAGPELTDVPLVIGSQLDAARETIASSRLTVGRIEERHDRQPKGFVLEQEPEPGRVRTGDPVNLIVSLGPEIIALPDFSGESFSQSEQTLRQKGFEVVRDELFSDSPAGRVVGQAPKAGEMVPQGTQVKLSVSKGPQPFPMPDLKGKPCNEAKAAGQGLAIVVRSSNGGEAACGTNRVLEQDPLAGTKVKKGQEVTLYVSG